MSTEKSPSYNYEKLHDHQVRLLVLDPGDFGAPLKCRIETRPGVELASSDGKKVHYEALSWCWPADQKDMRMLDLDTPEVMEKLRIPSHLYEALVNLRYAGTRKRRLWIDFLCINQQDIDERNHQVARMSEIYGHAKNVCVWLGGSQDSSDLAFKFVEEVKNSSGGFEGFLKAEYIDKFKALRDLMKRPWFIRRWVVQEIALARSATIHCGSLGSQAGQAEDTAPGKLMDWQDFAAVVSLLNDNESVRTVLKELAKKAPETGYSPDAFADIDAWGASKLISTTTQLKKMAGGGPQKTITLTDLVSSLAMFQTSEPRDTIYALLALAKDSEPSNIRSIAGKVERESSRVQQTLTTLSTTFSSSRHQHYPVDYQQSVLTVYQQYMQFSIEQTAANKALDVICRPFAQGYKAKEDAKHDKKLSDKLKDPEADVVLPSWMPSNKKDPYTQPGDTRNTNLQGKNSNPQRQYGDPFVSMPGVISYQAAGAVACNKRKIRFRKRSNHYSMYVEGFVLDTIKTAPLAASQLGNIPSGWTGCLRRKADRDKDPDVLWRTLVANRSGKRNAPYFFKMLLENLLQDIARSDQQGFDTGTRLHDTKSTSEARVLRQVLATLKGRSLFETPIDSQDLIGLGHGEVQKGDLVCIVYGCTVPVILRRITKSPEQIARDQKQDDEHLVERVKELEKQAGFMRKLRAAQRQARMRRRARLFGSTALSIVFLCATLLEHLAGYPMLLVIIASLAMPRVLKTISFLLSRTRPRRGQGRRMAVTALILASLLAAVTARATLESGIKISVILLVYYLLGRTDLLSMPSELTRQAIATATHKHDEALAISPDTRPLLDDRSTSSSVQTAADANHSDSASRRTTGSAQSSPNRPSKPKTVPAYMRMTIKQAKQDMEEKTKTRAAQEAEDRKSYFEVIGECYIDKMMNGEAIERLNRRADFVKPGNPEHNLLLRNRIFELR